MPPMIPNAFSDDWTRRIMAVVRRIEALPRNITESQASIPVGAFTRLLTKNDSGATWTKGSYVTINVYTGTQGSETSNGLTLSNVYVRLGDIANGKWAYVGAICGKLEVWNIECP